MDVSVIVILVVVTALGFGFTNGFHAPANALAPSLPTGALKPKVAVILAGILNLVGAFLSVEVAKTISSGLVDEAKITPVVIFGGLVGAILWNLITWLLGLPSSSSHALFGGLIGAVWVVLGSSAIHFDKVFSKIILPAVISPFACGIIALVGTYAAYTITNRTAKRASTEGFRHGQSVSACL